MADSFPVSDGDYNILSADSGNLVKVYRDNNSFRILKTNLPSVYGTISVTAQPYPSIYYAISLNAGSDPDRNGQLFPSSNPTITIYDTDILTINVIPDPGGTPYPLAITNNTSQPFEAVTVGSVSNNITGNGTIRWYPGAGNTGTFYYLYYFATSATFGGVITVEPTPT